jgi:DNA polymerase II small subunit/DNA polymerase delta subunit B
MNTLSFAFGMLAVVGLFTLVAAIVGLVKVYNHQSYIKELNDEVYSMNRDIHQKVDTSNERMHTVITSVETVLRNQFTKEREDMLRYVDSRLDKLETKLTTNSNKKDLIKG